MANRPRPSDHESMTRYSISSPKKATPPLGRLVGPVARLWGMSAPPRIGKPGIR